ncbi:MAG: hypothetical protein GVY09_13435 [Gammaproteobacteria bacterium]|jgi:REP element-mobilizing transposase RayT|nr:hypothetical protein [Gammaproteobacteria bacterium]
MPQRRISASAPGGTFFLTFTVQRWYYIFDRHARWQILAEALSYRRAHAGLQLHGFVFMLNHIHLIATAPDAAGFVRDFKRHTAARLYENLGTTEPRVQELFRTEDGGYSLWQSGSAAMALETERMFQQKLTYIHENPVRKQYVARPEHWFWSSANPDCPLQPDPSS